MRTASGGAGRLGAPSVVRARKQDPHPYRPSLWGSPPPTRAHIHALTHATKMIHKIITRFTYSPSPVTRTIIWKFRSHIVPDKQWDVRKTRASSPPLPPPPGERARGGTAWKSVCHRVSFGDYKHVRNVECFAFVFNFSPVDHVFVLSLSRFREQPATGSAEP